MIQAIDVIEAGSPGIVIAPLTTNLREENILRVRILRHILPGLEKDSDVLLDQIHTLDRTLFLKELGPLSEPLMMKIKKGIQFLLNL